MISSIQRYVSELPSEYREAASRSAFYSFVGSAIMFGSWRIGLQSALAAATASLVGSLIMPLLKRHLGDAQGRLSWKIITTVQLSGVAMMVYSTRTLNVFPIHGFATAFFTLLAIDLSIGRYLFNANKYGPVFVLV